MPYKAKNEKRKQKSEMESLFTEELEQKLVDYAVNIGSKICAAKTHEEKKTLARYLAYKTLNLNFFNAPPKVKRLKVFVKRDNDKSPFYVFEVTPFDCSHFFNRQTINIKKCIRFVEDENSRHSCPQDTRTKIKADPGSVARYEEHTLPYYTKDVDKSLKKEDSEATENATGLEYNLVNIKKEVDELIESEEPIQAEPFESQMTIEYREPIMKEELNIDEWMYFEQPGEVVSFPQNEKIQHLDKVKIKGEPKTSAQESIVGYRRKCKLTEE